ncbi:hypothetical protein QBC46DRAFT_29765 [Diplogelasinospora grovesii]|uniref:Dolichyl-diphosphooligosaccharide-protein glycosyltransferase subunit OST5 n=1 Tax=Diplogelasinospora grovesii TaxID=303347 RepID=A0AAN6NEP5_9PEZI|nr:hypothetical protein QBC46DRAFT_29765 [Diplogelasinospora grovesii]
MDSSLHEVWQAASGSPFFPTVGKGSQFFVGFTLLLLGLLLTTVFALSMLPLHSRSFFILARADRMLDRSLVSLPVIGIPASLAVAFGVVYMFCAVGVYV